MNPNKFTSAFLNFAMCNMTYICIFKVSTDFNGFQFSLESVNLAFEFKKCLHTRRTLILKLQKLEKSVSCIGENEVLNIEFLPHSLTF